MDGRDKQPSEWSEKTTAFKKRKFLQLVEEYSGHTSRALRELGMARSTLTRWKEDDDLFAAQYDSVIDHAVEELEAEGRRRAMGYEEPVVYQGKIQGTWMDREGNICSPDNPDAILVPTTVTKFSDNLLMFLLKGHRPDKYRDGPGASNKLPVSEEEMNETIRRWAKRRGKLLVDEATDINN